jgi:CRP-like cAMP-binding protein
LQNIDSARDVVLREGWLSMTPPSFQSAVLDRCRLRRFGAGEVIYALGDPPGGMFGLVAGSVGITVSPWMRSPYIGHFARLGSWFGEAAAVTGMPRMVGLAATRETDMLHLPMQAINEIVGRDPAAWRMFAIVSLDHLEVAIGACDDLMIRDHVKRCVAVLLRLGGCRGRTPAGVSAVEIDASQEDIAALANVARTTLSGVLRKLDASGHLELEYRRIRIMAPDRLRAMLRD